MTEIKVTANLNTTIVKRGEVRTLEETDRLVSLIDSGVLRRIDDEPSPVDSSPGEPEHLGSGWYLMPDGTKQRGLESDA